MATPIAIGEGACWWREFRCHSMIRNRSLKHLHVAYVVGHGPRIVPQVSVSGSTGGIHRHRHRHLMVTTGWLIVTRGKKCGLCEMKPRERKMRPVAHDATCKE